MILGKYHELLDKTVNNTPIDKDIPLEIMKMITDTKKIDIICYNETCKKTIEILGHENQIMDFLQVKKRKELDELKPKYKITPTKKVKDWIDHLMYFNVIIGVNVEKAKYPSCTYQPLYFGGFFCDNKECLKHVKILSRNILMIGLGNLCGITLRQIGVELNPPRLYYSKPKQKCFKCHARFISNNQIRFCQVCDEPFCIGNCQNHFKCLIDEEKLIRISNSYICQSCLKQRTEEHLIF